MQTPATVVRPLAWLAAVAFLGASVLSIGLQLGVIARPPDLPPTTDFVDHLLSDGDFRRSIWPIDFASSLLPAPGFLATASSLDRWHSANQDPKGWIAATALIVGALLGLTAQLIFIGARQVQLDIAYCDCGYKVQEVISQNWAMWLIEGAVGWLVNGAGVAFAVGVVAAGAALGGTAMSSGWRLLAWLIGVILVINVAVGALGIEGPLVPLLVGLQTGVLVPIWLAWLALRAPRGPADASAA
jgi:hypothetical protein